MGYTGGLTWVTQNFIKFLPGTINVTNSPYSADNTGTVDAGAAIQSALNAGKAADAPVYFPAGTYKIGKTLILFQWENAYIFGDGSASTELIYTAHVPSTDSVTITLPAPGGAYTFTLPGHGYSGGEVFTLWPVGGTLVPYPIVWGMPLFVRASGMTTDTFQVSATDGGPAIVDPSFTVNTSTSRIILNSHGMVAGQQIRVRSTGTLPGGLSSGVDYYVTQAGAINLNDFQISTQQGTGGTPVTITSAGTGTHSFDQVAGHKMLTSLVRGNGVNFGHFESMKLNISGAATIGLDFGNQTHGPAGTTKNTNGDSFFDIWTKNAYVGMNFGAYGVMGSEMFTVDCKYHDHAFAGVITSNQNALGLQVYNNEYVRCGGAYTGGNPDTQGAPIWNNGNVIIIAGTTFTDSGSIDILSRGGEGKLVIDCTSTNANGDQGTGELAQPMMEFMGNQSFYQNVTFNCTIASTNHIITYGINNNQLHVNCNYPNGLFTGGSNASFPADLIVKGGSRGNPNAITHFQALDSARVTVDPATVTALNVPYAFPDFDLGTQQAVNEIVALADSASAVSTPHFSLAFGLRFRLHS